MIKFYLIYSIAHNYFSGFAIDIALGTPKPGKGSMALCKNNIFICMNRSSLKFCNNFNIFLTKF